MDTTGIIQSRARGIFIDQRRKALPRQPQAVVHHVAARIVAEEAGHDHTLLVLAEAVEELLHRPHAQAAELEPMVRQRLTEQAFVYESGDTANDPALHAAIELDIDAMLRTLEHVRDQILEPGTWRSQPAAPIMCG